MRIVFFASFLIAFAACTNSKNEKAEVKTLSAHSQTFNDSMNALMNDYYNLSEAFVNWDSVEVAKNARSLQEKLGSFSLEEIKKDSSAALNAAQALFDMNLKSEGIATQGNFTIKRQIFNDLTEKLYSFLHDVRFDEKKIYLQECPMAFNDTIPGDWLSQTDSIRNPYLGLHHPKYGKAMIDCGSTKATIDFTSGRKETKREDENKTNDSEPKKK